MPEVIQPRKIPDKFIPLYNAKDEHEILNQALALITFSRGPEQVNLLTNVYFLSIVNSALMQMDEDKPEFVNRIVESFSEPLREHARLRFNRMLNQTQS